MPRRTLVCAARRSKAHAEAWLTPSSPDAWYRSLTEWETDNLAVYEKSYPLGAWQINQDQTPSAPLSLLTPRATVHPIPMSWVQMDGSISSSLTSRPPHASRSGVDRRWTAKRAAATPGVPLSRARR
eukprot:6926278-Pyramimonas_sp.AAC.1